MRRFSPLPRKVILRQQEQHADKALFFVIAALTIFGVLMVADASAVQAETYFGDKFFFAKQQFLSVIVGLVAFYVVSKMPTNIWKRFATPLLVVSFILLAVVLVPKIGVGALGARRWLSIHGFTFQPSELMKLSLVLFFAKLFSNRSSLSTLAVFFGITAIVGLLVLLEPDLGTVAILASTAFTILFMSGAPLIIFGILAPLATILGFIVVWISPYRRERLMTFLGRSDPLNSSYHISQVLLALGAGGVFGVGLGQSRAKYLFLPEAATDSIFAIIAEEFGFVGAGILLLVIVWIVFRMYKIAMATQDPFGKLVASGVATWIAIQSIINIAAMTATIPITGIPLPLISHGGTALVITLVACGIVIGVSRTKSITR